MGGFGKYILKTHFEGRKYLLQGPVPGENFSRLSLVKI